MEKVPSVNELMHGSLEMDRDSKLLDEEEALHQEKELARLEDEAQCLREEITSTMDELVCEIEKKKVKLFENIDDIIAITKNNRKRNENSLSQLSCIRNSVANIAGIDTLGKKIGSLLEEEEKKRSVCIPSLKLIWNVEMSSLKRTIQNMGDILTASGSQYELKRNPIWSVLQRGKGDNELSKPGPVAIHSETGEIYVGDGDAGKILVFDKGGMFIRPIFINGRPGSFDKMQVFGNSIFCHSAFFKGAVHLYKLAISNGEVLGKIGWGMSVIMGVGVSGKGAVYTCERDKLILHSCDTDLKELNKASLQSHYLRKSKIGGSVVRDLRALQDDKVVVLFSESHYHLQIFTSEGIFVGAIKLDKCQTSFTVASFSIDSRGNIVLSLGVVSVIYVYTKDGKFITRLSQAGKGKGEITGPRGVASDAEDNTIVCDSKHNFVLQAF